MAHFDVKHAWTLILPEYTNAVYVLSGDSKNASSIYIYDASAKSWSTQAVETGLFDLDSYDAILDHDTNLFCTPFLCSSRCSPTICHLRCAQPRPCVVFGHGASKGGQQYTSDLDGCGSIAFPSNLSLSPCDGSGPEPHSLPQRSWCSRWFSSHLSYSLYVGVLPSFCSHADGVPRSCLLPV